jgi:Tol biopolymer transport system component
MRLLAAVATVLILGLSACGPPPVHVPLRISGPVADAPGRILYGGAAAFHTFAPSTMNEEVLAEFTAGSYVGEPAAAPDGRLIAYTALLARPDGTYQGGVDLYVMKSDGTARRRIASHDRNGVALTHPTWGADGTVYFTRMEPDGRTRIERVKIDGSRREVIVEDAHNPTLAPDGRLAYLTTDRHLRTQTLWLAPSDRRGNPTALAGGAEFIGLGTPRFSPDGQTILFAAAGGPVRRSGLRLLGVAHAHGVPWDLWSVNRDGTGLKALTRFGDGGYGAAWSSDGRWVAFSGELGFYLLDMRDGRIRRLTEKVFAGALVWLPSR